MEKGTHVNLIPCKSDINCWKGLMNVVIECRVEYSIANLGTVRWVLFNLMNFQRTETSACSNGSSFYGSPFFTGRGRLDLIVAPTPFTGGKKFCPLLAPPNKLPYLDYPYHKQSWPYHAYVDKNDISLHLITVFVYLCTTCTKKNCTIFEKTTEFSYEDRELLKRDSKDCENCTFYWTIPNSTIG